MTLAYEEIADFIASGPTPENVLSFQPSQGAKDHIAELLRKQKTDGLAIEEKEALSHYLEVEHIMRLAKAKARLRLGQ